jgi:hypothetical protein
MFLTDDELVDMTRRRRKASQRRVLMAMGLKYRVRPDGSLAVLRAHVEVVFGVASEASRKALEPRWDAI